MVPDLKTPILPKTRGGAAAVERSQGQCLTKPRLPHVAVLIESSRTYGRGILRGVARYAREHGPWSFFFVERDLHAGVPKLLETWRGDGIIARIENRRMAVHLSALGCPVVDVLGQIPFPGIPTVDTDPAAVAARAGEYFVQAGFQHFAFVGYRGVHFSDRRCEAFVHWLAQHGHQAAVQPCAAAAHRAANDIQSIERAGIAAEPALVHWLRRQARPLAVLTCNDICAQQVLNACREQGLSVPEEIAVMGVDNDDVLCELCDPPLTSIEPDTERLGREAAALLDRLMHGRSAGAHAVLLPPARLVERASVNTIGVQDPILNSALRFIRDHVGEGIAVKDVTAHLKRSRSDLEMRFRRDLHRTVRGEILRRRLARVRALLEETDLGLAAVSARSGFASATHLCRLFQQQFGQTPINFRRDHQITRAALSTCGGQKSNFLSAKVKSCCSEGESPAGLAESRRNLERKN